MKTKVIKSEFNVPFEIEVIQENDGIFSCHIPNFEMDFNAKNMEDVEKKAKFMVKCFINFFIEENRKKRNGNN